MPPPNTPEGGVTAPTSPPASPTPSQPTSPLTRSEIAELSLPKSSILELDYQSIEYIGPVDETLLCPICRTPFHSPITTPCGHTFCAGCINRALELQSVCPIDRQPINKTRDYCRLPLIVKDQLDRLKVKCPNKGCDHECLREHLEGHYGRRCEFTPVRCPESSCTKYIARRDAKAENGCLHQEFTCRFCEKVLTWEECDDHYDYSCNGATARCEECGKQVMRHRLGKHLSQDCPEAEARCKWHAAGCKVADKRRVVQEHEHSGCTFEVISRLIDQRAEDREMINDLTGRLARLEAASSRRRRPRERREPHNESSLINGSPLNLLSTEATGASNLTRNDDMSPSSGFADDDGAWASPEDYMLAQFERIEGQLEGIRKKMMEMDAHQSLGLLQTTARVNEQLAELGSKVGVLNMHTTWLMNMQRQSHTQQRTASTSTGPPSAGISHAGDTSTTRAVSSETGVRYQAGSRRSSSDGRGEHPPRL
ncbi:TNF receptor-associated factor 6 [Achaetomium macrosporum]|uniref:TNF receptor-associated factor 6 n=1 Tax=Achaetomium macrosporum TaxID=79813 RepID=A0AAN7CJH2_9PEZI|nr:TNF receptor-associated factor 6 [Achaetomium macrosporum]